MFERFFSLRYICIAAVISLFAGAVLMSIIGAERTLNAFNIYVFGPISITSTRSCLHP